MSKQYNWFRIADHINELDFQDNNISLIEVSGKKVCIGKYKDEIFAFTNKCPHAGGMMSEGYIDALGNVVCPMHRYKYDIRNGRNTSGEGYYRTHWPIETREDGIYVGMESGTGLFGWFKWAPRTKNQDAKIQEPNKFQIKNEKKWRFQLNDNVQ